MTQITQNPAYNLKGKPYARVQVHITDRQMKEKVKFVKTNLPKHYLHTGNRHYLSIEAFEASMYELKCAADGIQASPKVEPFENKLNRINSAISKAVRKEFE